jgi:hypothetical protein
MQIAKERQMEFDTETDPDTLYELFGEDAASFSEYASFGQPALSFYGS